MDTSATATIIQAIATVVALVGVAVTFILTSRGQRQDRDLARLDAERAERAELATEASAERSERAAALSIDTMTRIAVALEGIEAKGAEGNRQTGQVKVAWSLHHFSGDKYILENRGGATAFNVQLSAHESLMTTRDWPRVQDVHPGEGVTFIALRTMGTSDSTITVQWADSDDEDAARKVWRYPLPPRPPR
jgi:hypothetical protein